MIIDITVTLLTATATATAVNDIAVTVVLNDEVVNPEETFCERVDACLDIPTTNGNYVLNVLNGVKSWVAASGSATWGSIIGTITNQTDLVNYITTRLTGYATEAFVTSQGYITNVVTALGYTPENVANKTTTIAGNESSTTLYPNVKGVVDWIKQGMTALLSSLSLTKTEPVDADSLLLNDSADSNKLKLVTWANIKATLLTYFDGYYPRIIAHNINHYSHTGSTGEVKVHSLLLPANTYAVGDTMRLAVRFIKTGTANTWRVRVRVGTADDLTGAQIWTQGGTLAAGVQYAAATKVGHFNSTTEVEYYANSGVSDEDVITGAVNLISTFNPTVANYLVFSVELVSGSADTAMLSGYYLQKI